MSLSVDVMRLSSLLNFTISCTRHMAKLLNRPLLCTRTLAWYTFARITCMVPEWRMWWGLPFPPTVILTVQYTSIDKYTRIYLEYTRKYLEHWLQNYLLVPWPSRHCSCQLLLLCTCTTFMCVRVCVCTCSVPVSLGWRLSSVDIIWSFIESD